MKAVCMYVYINNFINLIYSVNSKHCYHEGLVKKKVIRQISDQVTEILITFIRILTIT